MALKEDNHSTVSTMARQQVPHERADNSSGITGVGWNRQSEKWTASITVMGKRVHLGYFHDKFDAICSRKSAENLHEFHENHGKKSNSHPLCI